MPNLCKLFFVILIWSYDSVAYAYLDPASGSMLLSLVVTAFATLYFSVRGLYYKLHGFLGYKRESRQKYGIVFYSEGKQYWGTFKPVIEALDTINVKCSYLSSDKHDEGLLFSSENIDTKYIGKGNQAYFYLNTLEAGVCITTTPGLDVLQIKRSKGVKHYSHLIHSPIDVGKYKLYSFDYFDSILCSGEHQIRSLRELESLRNTPKKKLLRTGCTYMDVLANRLRHTDRQGTDSQKTVLIAPSWGANGGLKKFGVRLIEPLLIAGYQVIVRPHPQSAIVEKDMLDNIKAELSGYSNIEWDNKPDNFKSMLNSDVMISDMSGAIFDYSFVFEKPVITIEFDYDLMGTDANDLSVPSWELTVLDQVGRTINGGQLKQLPYVVEDVLGSETDTGRFTDLRDSSLFNFERSGQVAAKQIVQIYKDIIAEKSRAEVQV